MLFRSNNVVIVSGELRKDSVIHIHVSILPQTPLPPRLADGRTCCCDKLEKEGGKEGRQEGREGGRPVYNYSFNNEEGNTVT